MRFRGIPILPHNTEAALNGAALSGATLSGATLSGATLSGATLSGATLSGATLSANVKRSNVKRSNVKRSNVNRKLTVCTVARKKCNSMAYYVQQLVLSYLQNVVYSQNCSEYICVAGRHM